MYFFLRIGIFNHTGPIGSIPLWQTRGYASPEKMTWGIISKLNELVRPDDIIFNLGDFCLNTNEQEFENYLANIKCQNIYYITGNHNSRIKDAYRKAIMNEFARDDIEVYPIRYKNIVFYGNYLEVVVDGQYICMCHYPIDIFNKMRHNSWMLCGHSHCGYSKTKESCLENKRLDVSWDGYLRPLDFNELQKIMAKKGLVTLDHH